MMRCLCKMLLCLALLIPVLPMSAQEEMACTADSVMADAEEAYTALGEALASDPDMTFDSVETYYKSVGAMLSACDEARYQAYIKEGTALLDDLREGGYVLYVRHAATDSSQSDTDLSSCETQRNLSDQGRMDAMHIGEWWVTMAVPSGEIISTEYCRTRETAEIAFGEPIIMEKELLLSDLDSWLSIEPEAGTNTIIVGHVDLLEDATGIRIPEDIRFNEGDALVFLPLGGPMGDQGYELVTRISLRNWHDLARIAEGM